VSYPQDADPLSITERVLALLQLRHRRQGVLDAATIDHNTQRAAGGAAHDLLHFGKAVDGPTIDREHHVVRLEAGGRSCAPRLHRVDARSRIGLAVVHEDAGEDHDSNEEIRERTGGHDSRANTDRLMKEAVLADFLRHGRNSGLIGDARGIFIPKKFYVTAERDRRKLPAGAVA